MNIISLGPDYLKYIEDRDKVDLGNSNFSILKDLTIPSIIYIDLSTSLANFRTIEVEERHEMRIDILLMDMYDIEPRLADSYLGNIDIICSINNIDNPLNIKKGMILRYPGLSEFNNFRVLPDNDPFNKKNNKSVKDLLVFPNKRTRKDSDREKFKDSGYSLPPVVLRKPKKPVSVIKDGDTFRISAGGI